MRKFLFLVAGLCFFQVLFSQTNRQLQNLQHYLEDNRPPNYDSSLNQISFNPGGNLHYLYPFYQLFIGENKFSKILAGNDYYNILSEAASFVCDYESALQYQKNTYDEKVDEVALRQINKTIEGFKNIEHADARKYIAFICRNYPVIMINEAHNKPLHRAFVLSLLEDLYKRGFRYLAMEMLDNSSNHELNKLTPLTGHYCSEPVAGELVRTALDIGYKLVSYEDTDAMHHNATQRDSIQAEHIYDVIRADSNARMLVLAGYGHIAEKSLSEDYIPMGAAFKKISGIDPLTIDQTNMTEESDFAYGKAFYDAYIQRFSLSVPSVALVDDQPVNPTNNSLYDLAIIHPRTIYRDARPAWLNLSGRRQPLYVKPSNKNTFLVQAYYQFETFGSKPGQVIPADQTYIPGSKGNYLLYLKRGKYIVLFRDMNYKILNTQHIEVN